MNKITLKNLIESKLNEEKDKLFMIHDTGMDGRDLNGEVLWYGYAQDKEEARKKAKIGDWGGYYVGEVTVGEMNKMRKKLEDQKNYLDKQIKILSKPIK